MGIEPTTPVQQPPMASEEPAAVGMDPGTRSQVEPAGEGDAVPAVEGKGFGVRAIAFALDTIALIVAGVAAIYLSLLALGKPLLLGPSFYAARLRQDAFAQPLNFLLAVILAVLYFVLCEWLYGATPGKFLLRMRVVKTTGDRCSMRSALIRGLLRLVDGLFLGWPAYAAMTPPLRQRFGDKTAQTIVVGSRAPLIAQPRPGRWLLIALGLFSLFSAGSQIGLMRFVDRAAAPGDPYVEQATAARALSDHARAAELFERAIDAGIPQDRLPNIYFLLGNEYYDLGDAEKAIKAQQDALAIDPEFYPSWTSLGTVYWTIDEVERAIVCYRYVVALAPDQPEGHVSLGWLYLEQGDVEQALESLDQALRLDPGSGTAHAYRAVAYALQGRFEEAELSLQQARKNGYADWQAMQRLIESLEAER